MTDPEQDTLRRGLDALEQRVRALERAEADSDIRLTTHRAIITQVALVELAKLTGLTQEDWKEALNGFAAHIRGRTAAKCIWPGCPGRSSCEGRVPCSLLG